MTYEFTKTYGGQSVGRIQATLVHANSATAWRGLTPLAVLIAILLGIDQVRRRAIRRSRMMGS